MTDLHERLRTWWDLDGPTYDDSPSHALDDPVERACWRAALRRYLPEPTASVLDAGARTGAIGLLAAELGYEVTALDLSPNMLGTGHDHHAPYDPEILASLPLAGATTLGPLLDAVRAAEWSSVRVERLRDVEWARRRSAGPLLGWLEHAPRFAIFADA